MCACDMQTFLGQLYEIYHRRLLNVLKYCFVGSEYTIKNCQHFFYIIWGYIHCGYFICYDLHKSNKCFIICIL